MLLAPFFLLGLLAIGLPIWLHRFARRTEERRRFASLMLLRTTEVQRSRRHTLRYWLLLALRVLLLMALALAFAEPVLRARIPLLANRVSTLHVIVVDTSLSMQEQGRWQRAIERARALIDGLDARDRVMLVAADHRVRVLNEPVFAGSVASLRTSLATLTPSLTRLDYGMLMTSAESWLDVHERPAVLHLVTDLQQSALPLRFADLEPPAGVTLQLENVADKPISNLAVAAAALADDDADAIVVHLAGELAATTPRRLILDIDGKEVARRTLSEADLGSSGVKFASLKLSAAQHRVVARLEPQDALPQDDQFYVAIKRIDPRVLILTQNTSADDATYLAAAVGSITRPHLQVERQTPSQIKPSTLSDYAAIVVSDAGILSPEVATALQKYVLTGGAVMMTLGERAATLRTVPVSGHSVSRGLLNSGQQGEPERVATVEQSHPVLRDAKGWRAVRFFRYVAIDAQKDDKVLLRFERGAPLMLERVMGKGHLLLFTSSLSREWNDLALEPLFVRFIAESAQYLTGLDAALSATTVGSVVNAGVSGSAGAQVFDPKGQRALTLGQVGTTTRLVPDQTGFYEVRGGGRVEWLAVNVDPRESLFAQVPDEELRRWQALQLPAVTDSAGATHTMAEPPLIPVWFWVLLFATLLAFLEPLVANYHLHVRREGSL